MNVSPQPVKNLSKHPRFWNNKGNGGVFMGQWRKGTRSEAVVVDLEDLVLRDQLLRQIEKVMDHEWLYERLNPYYSEHGSGCTHKNGSYSASILNPIPAANIPTDKDTLS